MPMHQRGRKAQDELISEISGGCSANGTMQNMTWTEMGIPARTPSKWNAVLVVSA